MSALPMRIAARRLVFCLALVLPAAGQTGRSPGLPTGVRLDAVGRKIDVGNMPLALAIAPGGRQAAILLSGWREQGLQIVDLRSGRVTQTLPQPAAFIGLAFAPDGSLLCASGGNSDDIYCYKWAEGAATLDRTIALVPHNSKKDDEGEHGSRYPAGLAFSADGKLLYVAENIADSLAVVEVATGNVLQRLPTERYPYAVAVAPDGTVYVSAWGGQTVSIFDKQADGRLLASGRLQVGRHPSALVLNHDGSRIFVALASADQVAVVDTRSRRIVSRLNCAPPAGPSEGSTPNALALSADGTRLFVAEADNNAIAVFALSPATRGKRLATHGPKGPPSAKLSPDRLLGRIPTDWYPVAVAQSGDDLLVLTGKGEGTGPNRGGPVPGQKTFDKTSTSYVLGQTHGTLRLVTARTVWAELASFTRRVAGANRWDAPRTPKQYPPFQHVIYIIKENRTYDQVFGDLAAGDGDPELLFFGRDISPNHHALAERFGLFDRFFTNAEVSTQGHMWSTAAYVTDFDEKTVSSVYSRRRREEVDEASEPASGFLWTLALKKGISFRDYGEALTERPGTTGLKPLRPGLAPDIHPTYPPFNLNISDQHRADLWIAELQEFVQKGAMPQLEIVWLPSDHTAGAMAGMRTPRAFMADNDLALGRMIEALSHTPFWRDTVVFVVEDDAQNGPDHVDSHRAPFLVISPYNRPGTQHRFINTTDVLATMEQILGLESLSQFDYFSRPLFDVFSDVPDLTPFTAIGAKVSLDERNPGAGKAAELSQQLRLEAPDESDDGLFNRILWMAVKGQPKPAGTIVHRSALHLLRMAQ